MNMLNQSLAIGPLGVGLGQLLLAMAFVVALGVGAWFGRGQRGGVGDTLFTLLLVTLAGARLVFVIRYWDSYDGLGSMLDIRDQGFDLIGALGAGALYLGWRVWRVPAQRKPIAAALFSGALTWSVLAGSLTLMESTARPLPGNDLVTLEGRLTSLPELAIAEERPMVVNLWATWCPPCRREMPVFEDAQQTRNDITFVFVNQGESAAQVERFLDHESLNLDNVLLDGPLALGEATGAMAMPTTLYYNADGELVDTHFGELSQATLQRGLDRLN